MSLGGKRPCCGLFVGLVTLDLIYRVEQPPQINEKIVALDYMVAAGGPATNAAVAFSGLGQQSKLMGVLGSHPITGLIQQDLQQCHVQFLDLAAAWTEPPPTSSIMVTQTTGERAVVSLNALRHQGTVAAMPADILANVDIVLIDGHQLAVGCAIAQLAQAQQIPVVLDGGSWKPGLEQLLPFIDYAVCSANFCPPGCTNPLTVLEYLQQSGIHYMAITHGKHPIQYWSPSYRGSVKVPQVAAVDTLGAGDIFHGAFCYYILRDSFINALNRAAAVAAYACQSFGTRDWLHNLTL